MNLERGRLLWWTARLGSIAALSGALALGVWPAAAGAERGASGSELGLPSRAEQLEAGDNVYRNLVAQNLIVTNSPYAPVLKRIGARIAHAAALQGFAERFYIIIGNQMNAFSGPDGRVYVNEGLLRQVDDEDELANVLAHESAHLVLGHLAQQMRVEKGASIVQSLGKLFGQHAPAARPGRLNVMGLVTSYSFLNFTRQQEYAADHLGVQIAADAHFNPWGTVWFLQEVYRLYGDAGYESYVQHHPSVSDRIAKIEHYFRAKRSYYGRWPSRMPPGYGLTVGCRRAGKPQATA